MTSVYILPENKRITLVQLPVGVGRLASSLPKTRWNKLLKSDLIEEALYRGLPVDKNTKKPLLISQLMKFYNNDNFKKGELTLPHYRFQSMVSRYLVQYLYRNNPRVRSDYDNFLKELQGIIEQGTAISSNTTGSMYTLESVYGISNDRELRSLYQNIISNPNVAWSWSTNRYIREIVIEAHNRQLLSDNDFEIHNSKSFAFIVTIATPMIDRLIQAYGLTNRVGSGSTKLEKALALYRNGVNYHDLLYAASHEPDMITGRLDFQPAPGSSTEGVWEENVKVEKDQSDVVKPIFGLPYTYLPVTSLRRIADSRDIAIPRGKHQLVFAQILSNYDQIYPDWVHRTNNASLDNLNRTGVSYRAAAAGIDMVSLDIEVFTTSDLRRIVRLADVVMPHQQPLPSRPTPENWTREMPTYRSFTEAYSAANLLRILIPPEKVQIDRFRVFGKNKTSAETAGYLAELTLYPSYLSVKDYLTVATAHSEVLRKLLFQKYNTDDILFLNDDQVLFIATRGYILPLWDISQIKQRYESIKDYPNSLVDKLRRVYGIPAIVADKAKYAIARSTPNPIEQIIVYFSNQRDEMRKVSDKNALATDMAKRVGMIIPSSANRKDDYFWRNVAKYSKIFTRPGDIGRLNMEALGSLSEQEAKHLLKMYTDNEIFQYTGAYLPYEGRGDIIENAVRLRGNRQFFIPTVRACANEETITTLEDTVDMSVFIIAYGTMYEYFCYDVDDFIENFAQYPIEGAEGQTVFRFRKPDSPGDDFTRSEIQQLVKLVELYPTKDDIPELVQRIRDGLRQIRDVTAYDREVMQQFNRLSSNDKAIMREWFNQLFLTGMYMRRWKGPGHPYPLREINTQGPDPNTKVNQELTVLGYYPLFRKANGTYPPANKTGITARMSQEGQRFVDTLRSVEYRRRDGNMVPIQVTRTIGYYLDRVRKMNMCIRMASTLFAGTASYYLTTFFNETIDNFDPQELDLIV